MLINRVALPPMIGLVLMGAVCSQRVGDPAPSASVSSEPCAPIETRAPNGKDQSPAFSGQTRACAVKSNVAFDVAVLTKGLSTPWAVEPLPGGDLLVTEKPSGRLRIVSATGEIGERISPRP